MDRESVVEVELARETRTRQALKEKRSIWQRTESWLGNQPAQNYVPLLWGLKGSRTGQTDNVYDLYDLFLQFMI